MDPIHTVEMHTGGEPVRIVTAGYPPIPGETLLAKRRYAREHLDHLRRTVIFEPRGHYDMYGVVPVDPDRPEADLAVLFMHNEGYSTMCGHATIALGRWAVDSGLVPAVEPLTTLTLQVPAGLVRVSVDVTRGRTGATRFESVPAFVFTRAQYIPECCNHGRSVIIPPAIDPFSAKNQELHEGIVRAILVHAGIVEGPPGPGQPVFHRQDGSPERVDRQADIVRHGRAPHADTPLVVQVSRWDPLKDPIGVMDGFARLLDDNRAGDAHLVLAGPNVTAIADDPEGAETLDLAIERWRCLPHGHRGRIHLACLPMADSEENAAIVNALQRHASVVVQKSLQEGFGLTVTEAMWKGRAVVGSAVGGIQEQIEDGVSGLLLRDSEDITAFGLLLQRLLDDPVYAETLGQAARERVRSEYLGLRQLIQHAELLERIDA